MNKNELLNRLEFLENMEGRIKTDIDYYSKEKPSIHITPYNETDLKETQKELKEVREALRKIENY